MLVYAAIAQVIAENILGIDHTVAEYLYFFAVTDIDISLVAVYLDDLTFYSGALLDIRQGLLC